MFVVTVTWAIGNSLAAVTSAALVILLWIRPQQPVTMSIAVTGGSNFGTAFRFCRRPALFGRGLFHALFRFSAVNDPALDFGRRREAAKAA